MNEILSGIRVLDLSRYIAGPYCGQILADMGAEVIKIEKYNGGDETRSLGPWANGVSIYYPAFNRNKKSVTVDFRSDKGKEIIKGLIAKSDVVIENFRPGIMDLMGISYETMKQINPSIILASVTGFGQYGPYLDRAAFDSIVTFMSGISWIHPALNEPVRGQGAISDVMAAMYAAMSIALALYDRKNTGKGQWLDVAMLTGSVSLGMVSIADYAMNGVTGPGEPDSAPQGPCKTCDGWVSIHAGTGPMFKRVKTIISDPRLHDPKYEDVQLRVRDCDYLMCIIEEWMSNKTCDEAEKIFSEAGIPIGVLGTWDRVIQNPQLIARNDIVSVNVPGLGKVPYAAFPTKFSEHTMLDENFSSKLGEHNQEIFSSLLGMSQDEIDSFPTPFI